MSRREGTRTLALAFMAGVVGGFVGISVTSWLADGPEILGASWWEVMTAFGTIGAAIGAVWIALSDRSEAKRVKKVQSIIYVWKINPFLKELDTFMSRVLSELGSDLSHRDQLASEIDKVILQIEGLDLGALFDFDHSVCVNVIQVRNGMKNLRSIHQNAFHDDGVIKHSFQSMLILVSTAQSIIKRYDGDRYLS
nr:hypothetical protein 11 [Pseudomonadaceae bacterium]